MKYLLAISLLISSCSVFTLPDEPVLPPEPRDASGRVLEAVVALVSNDGRPFCAGTFVGGKVITAAHCVSNDDNESEESVLVSNRHFEDAEGYFTGSSRFLVVRYDRTQDLAVLDLASGEAVLEHEDVVLAAEAPVYGQTVVAIGHPIGLTYTMTSGIVSHPRRLWVVDGGLQATVQTDSNVYFGNSGGPLFNRDSELVGVCSFIMGRQAHLGFFTHLNEVRAILAL